MLTHYSIVVTQAEAVGSFFSQFPNYDEANTFVEALFEEMTKSYYEDIEYLTMFPKDHLDTGTEWLCDQEKYLQQGFAEYLVRDFIGEMEDASLVELVRTTLVYYNSRMKQISLQLPHHRHYFNVNRSTLYVKSVPTEIVTTS